MTHQHQQCEQRILTFVGIQAIMNRQFALIFELEMTATIIGTDGCVISVGTIKITFASLLHNGTHRTLFDGGNMLLYGNNGYLL